MKIPKFLKLHVKNGTISSVATVKSAYCSIPGRLVASEHDAQILLPLPHVIHMHNGFRHTSLCCLCAVFK